MSSVSTFGTCFLNGAGPPNMLLTNSCTNLDVADVNPGSTLVELKCSKLTVNRNSLNPVGSGSVHHLRGSPQGRG